MRVLLTGANGQLGRALQATAPAQSETLADTRNELNIGDEHAVKARIAAVKPQLIINSAAYTAVDKAENEEGEAARINADAVGYLARAAEEIGARLIHISTDFVFDGTSGVPYRPDSPTAPIGAYGRTKLAGEKAAGGGALIVRTAWVYGSHGHNFVRTMLRLMAERDEVRVVADQIGTPTFATSLAGAIWKLAEADVRGIYHYTDSGVASWYDFALAIQEEAVAIGLLDRTVPVVPIATVDFPTPARRPSYSVLDKSATFAVLGGPAPHWRVNLRRMLQEVKENG